MSSHDQELHQMTVRALTLVETIDITDIVMAYRTLDELDSQLDAIGDHIEMVDTLVVPVLEHTSPGCTVALRERHGIITRGLGKVRDRAAELDIALDEQRGYCDELAVDLYLALASLALRTAQLDRTWPNLSAAA
jgi:hypothetical protein